MIVSGLSDAVDVSAWRHTCALRATGEVVCWGPSDSGELGTDLGGEPKSLVPVTVSGLSDAVGLSTGAEHTCATRATGEVVCWGDGGFGQLGDGRPWWTTPQAIVWTKM